MRDEGGGRGVPVSPSDTGPTSPAPIVAPPGGTHPQKTSMATRPASRMAKRMERMEVRAIMPALCPLPVVGMLLNCRAGERAGGERGARVPRGSAGGPAGARCIRGRSQRAIAACKRGVQTQRAMPVCKRNAQLQRANTACRRTVPSYPGRTCNSTLPQFPWLLARCAPSRWCSACSPPRTTPHPPNTRRLRDDATGRTSTPAAVPIFRVMGSDQAVSATGLESFKARNFTLGWEGRLATVLRPGGAPGRGGGACPHRQTHW